MATFSSNHFICSDAEEHSYLDDLSCNFSKRLTSLAVDLNSLYVDNSLVVNVISDNDDELQRLVIVTMRVDDEPG